MNDKVTCCICQRQMSTINNKHLASHNITAEQYKQQFPEAKLLSDASAKKLSDRSIKSNESRKGVARSEETRKKMSEAQKGRTAHNKGVAMSKEQKQQLSELAKQRYNDGFVHPNQGKHHSEETKEKISQALRGIPQGPERALKAFETKRENGMDLRIRLGATLSDETKQKIGQKTTEYFDRLRPILREPMRERIQAANLTLLNEVTDDVFKLRCNTCDYEFTRNHQMFHPSKYKTTVCDQCFPIAKVSKAELEIKEMIIGWLPNTKVVGSDAEQISPLELDIYLPDYNLAIEYNGLYRHSELAGKHSWYHRHKFDACKKKNIKLVSIFEDEWLNKKDIITSMLWNAFNLNQTKLNARDCSVEVLENVAEFLDKNHIQGHGRSNVKYGLFHEGQLVSAMTFNNNEVSRKHFGWEINRFATLFDTSVRGGASKLFSQFVKDYKPEKVTSYADLRFGEGNVYGNLGFSLYGLTVPGYWYFKKEEIKRYHRFTLRKTPNDSKEMTEWDIRQQQGWNRIWDCGHAKWIWSSGH